MLANDPAFLGINIGSNLTSLESDLTSVGIKLVRRGGNAGVSAGNLTAQDDLVDRLKAAGYTIHWPINYRGNGINIGSDGRNLDTNPTGSSGDNSADFNTWVSQYKARSKEIMTRYRGDISYYIVGNEPDGTDSFTGYLSAEQAVRFTRAAWEAANEVNATYGTNIRVESAPTVSLDTSYLRSMIVDHQLASYTHVIGVHAYGGQFDNDRIKKPFDYLAEAGALGKPVAISEAGVSRSWVPSNWNGTDLTWQRDFIATAYSQTKAFGYESLMLFNRDNQPNGWGLIRTPSFTIQTTTRDELRNNFDLVGLSNANFNSANDSRHQWVAYRGVDQNLDTSRYSFQQSGGRNNSTALRLTANSQYDTRVRQTINGVTPGVPITITVYAKRQGGAQAKLVLRGYDDDDGRVTSTTTTTSGSWTKLSRTVTPENPWVVIELAAGPTSTASSYAWFDDVTVTQSGNTFSRTTSTLSKSSNPPKRSTFSSQRISDILFDRESDRVLQ